MKEEEIHANGVLWEPQRGMKLGVQDKGSYFISLMFIYFERQRETEREQERGRERGRQSRLQALSCPHRARRGA